MNVTISSRPVVVFELPPMYNARESTELFTFVIMALLGAALSSLSKLVNIPHQIPAIASGVALGITAAKTQYLEIIKVDSSLLLSVFVPLVIAKITYTNDNYLVVKSLPQLLVITILGNIVFIPSLALLISILQRNKVNFLHVLVISLILTPNQCPGIPDLDGIKNLETLMIGESVLSIALCLTCYTICLGVIQKVIVTWYQVICVFLRYVGFAIPIGYLFGVVASICFRLMFNDSLNAVCTVFAVSFFVYNFCEHIVNCNGSLASFISIYSLTQERTRLLSKVDQDIKLCINVSYYFIQIMYLVIYITFIVERWVPKFIFYDVIEGIATYIMGNVLRLILFLLLSPILSRIGYGFDFASLVTIIWAVQKGPLQLILAISVFEQELEFAIGQELLFYTLLYVLLTYMINGTTLKLFLKRFGLIHTSNRRMSNVSSGIRTMNESSDRILAMLKLNRFYSDANWVFIYAQTQVNNPFEDFASSQKALTKDTVICHVCHGIVPLPPSKEEYNEIFMDVTLRALKAQRVSFVRLHETGYLSKVDVRVLLQAVEVAMDSTEMDINVENLFKCIDDKNYVKLTKTMKKILTIDSSIKLPKSGFRKICYYIAKSIYFEIFIHLITIADMAVVIVRIVYHLEDDVKIGLIVVDFFCIVFFLVESILIPLSYAHVSFFQRTKIYFKNHWNKIDFLILVISTVDLVVTLMYLYEAIDSKLNYYLKWVRLLLCLKLLKVISIIYPYILAYYERRKDMKLMQAFIVALAIVVSYEDVIDILPTLTQQSNIRDVIKMKLIKRRNAVTQTLGILEKERPYLTTTVKTKQALRSILKFTHEGITDLHASGLIDNFEYQKLNNAISVKQKCMQNLKILDVTQPKTIFDEVPWLYTDTVLLDYIYKHVKTRIFHAGDIVCKPGDNSDGVYITVAGYFKVTYFPTGDEIQRLKENGELPIKEYLEYMRFDEVHEDYLTCGNRIGELAFLTNRPHCCLVVSEAPSQAFIIPRDILQTAMTLSPDPVLGLGAKIWKSILAGLGRRILLTTPTYQQASEEQVDYAINRAIVPNISYYNIISLCHVVEDVLLLEGIVVDFRTREIFTAPCAIPRHVTKLIMPRSTLISLRNIMTKLMFFPMQNTDEYEMMQIIERNSELMASHNFVMLTEQAKKNTKRIMQSNMFNFRKPITGASSFSNKLGESQTTSLTKAASSRIEGRLHSKQK